MCAQRLKNSLFLILILGICLWLSFFYGLTQHWLIKSQISQLSGPERETAESEFYSRGKSEYLLAGTLAKINTHGEGGVWVWTNKGLKYFPADENTFYSYYDICQERRKTDQSEFSVDDSSRKITSIIKEWVELANVGDFVQLILSKSDTKGGVRKLQKIYAYSQPLFLPLNLEVICQK